ncbi:MAG: transcription termination factor Rho [Desulfobacterales bacterium]|nr:transcription termination factor Rho [Desulfobacterales bacterium]
MAGKKKATKEKPLEKMTAKELREFALNIPDLAGVHGMNKDELIRSIQVSRGMESKQAGSKKDASVREIKKKIRKIKAASEDAAISSNPKMSEIYKRRLGRLKKKTRRAA